MAGPGDEIAAGTGGRGRLRASHADREQVIEVLKAAFVQGRLDRDEFDLRVGRALASRTYADLAALTADITSARLTRARPLEPARESVNKKKKAVAALACATLATWACWSHCRRYRTGRLLPYRSWWSCSSCSGPCRQAGFCCSTHGLTSALAGSPRRGCHRAQAVRHPGAWHRPTRPGSSRRSIAVRDKRPKLRRSVTPARHCPVGGHRIEGTPSDAGTRSATPATDTARATRPGGYEQAGGTE